VPIGSIPLAPRFRLTRHHIGQVLCQVQFSPVLRLREEDAAIPFQERIRREYPRYSRSGALAMIIGPQGLQAQQEGPPLHRFESPDGVGVTLAPDFIALETRAYEHFEDFADRLVDLLGHVADLYEPPEMPRVGLRFVNELRLPSASPQDEMRRAITPRLLGAAATEELASSIVRSEQLIELSDERGNMLVRHGLFPDGGTTVQSQLAPPDAGVLNQSFYLLDIDAYRQEALPFDAEVAHDRAINFNEYIRSFFAWAVPEAYRREVMGQEDRP
jgi:uncharacterized protein (TIGR04255 family)